MMPSDQQLEKRKLGNTGLEVTCLGYGSMGLRGPNTWGVRVVSDEAADGFLNAVLDAGINFIDTAPDYGVSEQRIGRFIGSRRSEYILATKCGCDPVQHADQLEIRHTWTREVIRRNVEQSLERLRTDVIDVLQFHGGEADTLQRTGLIDQLVGLRAQGLVRFIGMSSKLPDLPALIQLDVFDTFQIPYSCVAPEHIEWLELAAERGAGIIVRGGIAQGGPDAEIQRPAVNAVWERAHLDDLLPEGMSRAELILRFTLSNSRCHTTIVGTCNTEHLQQNLRAAQSGPLPQALCRRISERIAALV